MKLEKEIEQQHFRNESHKLIVNLIYTYYWLTAEQSSIYKKYEITGQQFNILRILRGQHPKPANIKLLRERMLDKMSDASRIVEKLRVKKLLERTTSESDRRHCEVRITEKGLALLTTMDKEDVAADAKVAALSPAEMQQLNSLLDRLRG